MKFNLLKTRLGKLENNIKMELTKPTPNYQEILKYVIEYEKDNLETIEKLKRDKKIETNKINGALKSTIHAHGPITMMLIGSATKRIYGTLLDDVKIKKLSLIRKFINRLKKWFN